MQVYIKTIRWAINRVDGRRTQRVWFNGHFPAVVGLLTPLCDERRTVGLEATDAGLSIAFRYLENPAADTVLPLTVGEESVYAPRAFGAGYVYHIILK